MKKASTEDLRIFLMEVTDEIGSAHPETRDTKISARLLRDILTELLANREAQPVAEVLSSRSGNDTSTIDKALPAGTKLYTAPPVPAVPGKITPAQAQALCPSKYYVMNGDELNVAADFWNACRAAMLAQPVSSGCKVQDDWIACSERMPELPKHHPEMAVIIAHDSEPYGTEALYCRHGEFRWGVTKSLCRT